MLNRTRTLPALAVLMLLLLAAMVLFQDAVITAFVPPDAVEVFVTAWLVSAVVQPLNALCFATDGIHWGTRDFGYLRNGMFLACGISIPILLLVNIKHADALIHIWWITGLWVLLRAAVGLVRVWPGIGAAPIGNRAAADHAANNRTDADHAASNRTDADHAASDPTADR